MRLAAQAAAAMPCGQREVLSPRSADERQPILVRDVVSTVPGIGVRQIAVALSLGACCAMVAAFHGARSMGMHRHQRAGTEQLLIEVGGSVVYHTFDNKNAYAPFGAIDIDEDPEGVDVLDAKDCQDRCTLDQTCGCVTFKESKLKCWKRRECVVSKMTSPYNEGYTVFVKSAPRGQPLAGSEPANAGPLASAGASEDDAAAPGASVAAPGAGVAAGGEPTAAAPPAAEAAAPPPAAGGVPVGQPLKGGYTMYKDLNAFEPFGCTDITSNDDTTWGTEEECMAKCTADANCDCATYERATGGCWNRCNCVLAEMTSGYNEGFNLYVKD
ncbi:unnamed protein product, partial [Prorocentrum cordatum]